MATETWSTQHVAPADRLDAWSSVVGATFEPLVLAQLRYAPDRAFRASLRRVYLSGITMSRISGTPHTVRRAPRLGQYSETEACLKIYLQVSGKATLTQDGRTIVLGPGQLAVYDTSRGYELVMDQAYVHQVLRIPWPQLLVRPGDVRGITATPHPTDRGVERLVAQAMRHLDGQSGSLTEPQTYAALAGIVGMVDATLSGWLGVSAVDDDRELARAFGYIDAHLRDLTLTPATVAAAQFMSLRSLQSMFARQGLTPSGWIRHRRLERCRSELLSASARRRSVSEIARSWGFLDSAHFSRVFKATYGACPRDTRIGGDS